MLAIIAIVMVGGATVFFYRHIRSDIVPADTAAARIAAARARFGSNPAFLRVDADGRTVVNGREDVASSEPLAALRALAYDPRSGKLIDVSIPFWMLRLVPNGRISLDAGTGFNFDAERLNLNLAALEELGAGLVLDHSQASGTRLLVWTE